MDKNCFSDTPPVCDYTDSDYQQSFWDAGKRRYEDAAEEIALKRLLNRSGSLLIELGAGAGRNTKRYSGFDRVVLVDYSRTQLLQARQRLGDTPKYLYVAADIYKLPFAAGLFDGATMIRTLHHFSDVPSAFREVRRVMAENGIFILEFANKRNLKAIARYLFKKQDWNPYDQEPIEFVKLNFDFHPRYIWKNLQDSGFAVEDCLAVSHFRAEWFKKHLPHKFLVSLDAALQPLGRVGNFTPSVFTRLRSRGSSPKPGPDQFFACPICGCGLPESGASQTCPECGHLWEYEDGIYEFRIHPA